MLIYLGLKFVDEKESGGFYYDLYEGHFKKFIKRFDNMWIAFKYINTLKYRALYYREE